MVKKLAQDYIEYFKMLKEIEEFHLLAEKYGFLSPRLVKEKEAEQKRLREKFLSKKSFK
jgi:hypothetical protein